MAELALHQVTKRFGEVDALRGVSLTVRDGEFFTLLGPSGCGKSTLLRIIAGLERPTTGTVTLGGRKLEERPAERYIAMVFQSYALYPHMSAWRNIATPLEMRTLPQWARLPILGRIGARRARRAIDERVREVASTLEIEPLLNRKPGALSGGQRQRVALARAMVREPAVFLMDEPLSNLDAKLRGAMRAEIRALHRRLGRTFIFVTHDQSEAMTLSDRVAVVMDGRLQQIDTPRALYACPANRDVAAFVGSPAINLLDGRVSETGIAVAGTTLPLKAPDAIGAEVTVGIRPEALRHAAPGTAHISGTVCEVEVLGGESIVHLRLPTGDPLVAKLPFADAEALVLGATATLSLASADVLLFAHDGRRLDPVPEPAPATIAEAS